MSTDSAVLIETGPVIMGAPGSGQSRASDPLDGLRLLPSERREYDGLRDRGCSHEDTMAKIGRYLFHPPQ